MAGCVEVPHHITSIFIPYTDGPPEEQGSIGAGLTVLPPARACPRPGDLVTSTAKRTLELLGWSPDTPLSVKDPLPPGAGYSVSASTSLAAGLLYAWLQGIPVSRVFKAAHVAEILEATGLGDVLAISCGLGIVVRVRPGPPGRGSADCIPLGVVGVLSFNVGTQHTRTLIREAGRLVETARRRLERIIEDPSLETFIHESQAYTLDVGAQRIFPRWRELEATPGLIGYYFKKRVAVVLVEYDWIRDAVEYLEGLGAGVRILQPSSYPYRVGV